MSENMAEMNEQENVEEKKTGAEMNSDIGRMVLSVPIRSRSTDVTELLYDFTKITSAEYIEAMDSDRENANPFRISHKQSFNLFAAAAAKATDGIDATDIRERMSAMDVIYASQIASLFFARKTQEAVNRTASV